MSKMKSLVKDTAIYGLSSILGRFLNWCLVPIYTFVLKDPSEYGIVTNLYAWTAFVVVILTYGMETGFFRFINKSADTSNKVYSTSLTILGFTSTIFAIISIVFAQPLANAIEIGNHPEYIWMLGIVVSMDAFGAIPFAYLRYKNKPIKFAALKFFMIFVNIAFNLFFLITCPWLNKVNPGLISWFYNPDYGVGYIVVANLISTGAVTLAQIPDMLEARFDFDKTMLKQMLKYSFPLLILGIAGVMNQSVDKIIFPKIYPDINEGMRLLGIYGACSKISLVMWMFTQAFRFAYEPFVFAHQKSENSEQAYADAMKYFVIFSLIIFLGMQFYIDALKVIIDKSYWEGFGVVPIILMSYVFQGIYFNLSVWYKLTDKTMYGAYFSVLGAIITVVYLIVFVPSNSTLNGGYMAAAWSSFWCYLIIMLISYFYGQKYFPIKYELKRIGWYFLITVVLFFINQYFQTPYTVLNYSLRSIVLIGFIYYILKKEKLNEKIPVLNKVIK